MMKKEKVITSEENAVSGFIEDLVNNIEKIERYFIEAPIDYGDRKDGFEELLIKIGKDYWLPDDF